MELPVRTPSPKRVYLSRSIKITFECDECGVENIYDHCVPSISYGDYTHVFYCQLCGWESEDKMCTLNDVQEEFIDVTMSDKYNLKVYKQDWARLL